MEGDLQGIIIAIEKTDWEGSSRPRQPYDHSTARHGISHQCSRRKGVHLGFGRVERSASTIHFESIPRRSTHATNHASHHHPWCSVENFQAEDDQLPVEVIDAVQAEAALQAPTSISTAGGEFVFEPTKHERPKVFRDPSPHASHAIHMGHITGLALPICSVPSDAK